MSKSSGLSLSLKSPFIDLGSYKSKALPMDITFSLLSPDAIQTFIPAAFNLLIEYFNFGLFFPQRILLLKMINLSHILLLNYLNAHRF